MEDSINAQSKTFIVEHLDPDLEFWSTLEYAAIAKECHAHEYKSNFILSSVPKSLQLPPELRNLAGLTIEHRSVEEVYQGRKDRICLLDPKAEEELSPSDGKLFDAFLFGGILGILTARDPYAESQILTRCRRRPASRPHRRASSQRLPDQAFGTCTNDHRHRSPRHTACRLGFGSAGRYQLYGFPGDQSKQA